MVLNKGKKLRCGPGSNSFDFSEKVMRLWLSENHGLRQIMAVIVII